jgi:hypothetical protein
MTPVNIKPKPQMITIPVITRKGKETRTVKATVYGPFAIHRDIGIGNSWTITHVPTGGWMYADCSVVHARRMVRQLLALPIDWEAVTEASIAGMGQAAKQALGHQIRAALR